MEGYVDQQGRVNFSNFKKYLDEQIEVLEDHLRKRNPRTLCLSPEAESIIRSVTQKICSTKSHDEFAPKLYRKYTRVFALRSYRLSHNVFSHFKGQDLLRAVKSHWDRHCALRDTLASLLQALEHDYTCSKYKKPLVLEGEKNTLLWLLQQL
eukprot:gb/GECG01007283.1/.p1 GENE.gb/GECG01007283.1/~~gb/GECG01007283.1/.p1  ORF type:complete len:152 (+),score=10.20 gb/GECG01007283.1/:1-456(+)